MTPKKGGYTTLAPALDLTTSLRGDFIFSRYEIRSEVGGGRPSPPPAPGDAELLSKTLHLLVTHRTVSPPLRGLEHSTK